MHVELDQLWLYFARWGEGSMIAIWCGSTGIWKDVCMGASRYFELAVMPMYSEPQVTWRPFEPIDILRVYAGFPGFCCVPPRERIKSFRKGKITSAFEPHEDFDEPQKQCGDTFSLSLFLLSFLFGANYSGNARSNLRSTWRQNVFLTYHDAQTASSA